MQQLQNGFVSEDDIQFIEGGGYNEKLISIVGKPFDKPKLDGYQHNMEFIAHDGPLEVITLRSNGCSADFRLNNSYAENQRKWLNVVENGQSEHIIRNSFVLLIYHCMIMRRRRSSEHTCVCKSVNR